MSEPLFSAYIRQGEGERSPLAKSVLWCLVFIGYMLEWHYLGWIYAMVITLGLPFALSRLSKPKEALNEEPF